jgi:hypothetical protein
LVKADVTKVYGEVNTKTSAKLPGKILLSGNKFKHPCNGEKDRSDYVPQKVFPIFSSSLAGR